MTTTRTVNPYVSGFGRLLKFGAPGTFSGPLKLVPGGNRPSRSERFTCASTPSNASVRDVVPSHQFDAIAWKSPGAVESLFGSDPGATSTLQVYA